MVLVTHQDNLVAVRGHHAWNVIGIDRYVWNTLSSVPTAESLGLVTVIISQGEAGEAGGACRLTGIEVRMPEQR